MTSHAAGLAKNIYDGASREILVTCETSVNNGMDQNGPTVSSLGRTYDRKEVPLFQR